MKPADGRSGPPAWMRALLSLTLPREERRDVLLEMDALYRRRRERRGAASAALWYARHGAAFAPRLALDRGARAWEGGLGTLASTARDARHGARVLARRPGYALACVLTLGVGVGGIGTVHNAANWVLLRPVPGVREPDRLVTLRLEVKVPGAGPAFPISDLDFADLRRGIPSFDGLAGGVGVDLHVEPGGGGVPRRVAGAVVTPGYFRVLGVDAWRGRLLAEGDVDGAGEAGAVVVSHRLWRELLAGRDPAAGVSIRVNGRPFRVVGVGPPGFHGAELPGATELWLPAAALPVARPHLPADALSRRGAAVWTDLVGRLSAGAESGRVAAEAGAAMAAIREAHPAHSFAADFRWGAYPGVGLSPRVRAPVRRTLVLLTGAGVLLLLLAGANLGNLSLVHATARAGETAVHAALGAGRGAMARRVLVEHTLLGLGGTVVALAVTAGGTRLFRDASLSSLGAPLQGMRLDGRVALVVAAVGLTTALAAALPAVAVAVRGRLLARLRGRRHPGPAARRTQAALVTLQVALSAALLVGAGLLARTVVNLRDVDPGFALDGALRMSVDPRLHDYDEARVSDLVARVEDRLAREPGVAGVGFVSPVFVRGAFLTIALHRPGADSREEMVVGAQFQVTPGFAGAAGLRTLAGRWFEPVDARPVEEGGERVIVIGESMARRVWPGVPLGAVVGRSVVRAGPEGFVARVVGVVGDARVTGVLDDAPPPVVFHPWGQGVAFGPLSAWVRAAGDPGALLPSVAAAVRSVEPSLPVYDLRTARQQADRLIVEQRVVARLALALAAVGLLLAGIGLHGVLGYAVTSRRREIGVRAALGAGPGAIVGDLVRRSLTLTLAGLVLGGIVAVPLVRVIESRLFRLDPLDPSTLATGAAALLAVSALAAWSPARRATRVSPVDVLSDE